MLFNVRRRRWPPRPVSTVLASEEDQLLADALLRHQDTWGTDEWRLYALFLEREGSKVASALRDAVTALATSRAKHSRRRKDPSVEPNRGGTITSVLISASPSKRAGRPQAFATASRASEAAAILLQMQQTNPKASKADALAEWYRANGQRASRARKDAGALKAMTGALRRLRNNSST